MTETRDLIADLLPSYDIGGELGRGGFGVVLAGRHRKLDRPVAIKQLPPALSVDAAVRARFVTEAQVLASLDHPHIVPVYDFVERDGICLLVMESLPGGTVWSTFTQRGLTPESACAILMVGAAGLHHAHQHGVLHRDVKPENMLFSQQGQLKVTDFGIAKVIGGQDALATSSGDILGTPAYMAPEQAEGRELGPAADVYASGVMLYELLCGRLPFSEDGGGLAIVYRHVYEQPTPLRDVAPHVPEPVAGVVMRALARQPEDRYATAEEFGVALAEAAASVFGPGWLARADVSVMSPGPILASAERATIPAADRTGASTVAAAAPPQAPPPPPPPAPPSQRVRPDVGAHVGRPAPSGLDAEGLVPVRQVLELPPRPWALLAAALAFVAAMVVVAFVGVGAAARSSTVPTGGTLVSGVSVASGRTVQVDLAHPVPVVFTALPALPARATQVQLRLSVLGATLAASDATPLSRRGPAARVSVNLSSGRYLVPGPVTASLRLLDRRGSLLGQEQFTLAPSGSGWATVPGGLALALLLFALAYLESLLRPLYRRGRLLVATLVGVAVLGALTGAVVAALAWAAGLREPTLPAVIVCAAVGAVAAIAAGVTLGRAGLRARVRRLAKRRGMDIAPARTR